MNCCKVFNIPKSSIRIHLNRRTKSKKIEAQTILMKQEKGMIITYIDEILEVEQHLISHMLKLKVVEICQGR